MKRYSDILRKIGRQVLKTAGLLSLLVPMLISFAACSDDIGYKSDPAGNVSGIILRLPNIESAADFAKTRGDGATMDAVAKEGAVGELYLFIFKQDGSAWNLVEGYPKDIYNEDNINGGVNSGAYKDYKLQLDPGTYKFYLLANLSGYVSGGKTTLTGIDEISEITGLELQFSSLPLKTGNLPMACLSMVDTESNPSRIDNPITISDTDSDLVIYADLKFLCSKVRYTILFDSTDENMSKSFGNRVVDFNDEVSLADILKSTPVSSPKETDDDTDYGTAASPLSKFTFPFSGKYTSAEPVTDLSDAKNSWNSGDAQKRAWQGVVYLPENVNHEKKTRLTLSGTCYTSASDNNEIYHISKDVELCPEGMADGQLTRGNFYDIVLSVKNYDDSHDDIEFSTTVSVEDWTAQKLYYTLHGPYELEVSATTVKVESGEPGYLIYKSDIEPELITFEYPKIIYEGCQDPDGDPFFEASVYKENGKYVLSGSDYQIEVKVNKAIPYDVLQKVENGEDGYSKDDYKYFYIVAGKLHKMIEIDPLKLEGILKVNPKEIIVDVREFTALGIDNGSIDLTIDSNISNTITVTASNKNIYNVSDTNPFGIVADKGTTITTDDSDTQTVTLTKGTGKLILKIEKLFDGIEYWNSNHTYTLDFEVGEGENRKTERVTILVKRYSTNYTIHFRCNDLSKYWDSPHIYVYQALSLPVDLEGSNKQYAGKTVGYVEGDAKFTALEYAFTNDLAFKGWKGYGGPDTDIFDPNKSGSTNGNEGFFIFSNNDGYNPKSRHKAGVTCVYDFDMKFNENHTRRSACETCEKGFIMYNYWERFGTPFDQCEEDWKGEVMRLWPGIVMERETGENEGWWKYTLTGVATPRRAMIMFANGHLDGGKDEGYRYPGDNRVGIPLFDFPDNEGWFEFDGDVDNLTQVFKDDKPADLTLPPGLDIDMYLRGAMNDWNGSNHKFTRDGSNRWRLADVTIEGGDEFKFNTNASGDWDDNYNLGLLTAGNVVVDKDIQLSNNQGSGNMSFKGEFTGDIILWYVPATDTWYVRFEGEERETNVTVYWDNANDQWNTVKVYWYIKDNDGNTWPGDNMTKVSGTDYMYEIQIPSTAKYVIFNNGSGAQYPASVGFDVEDGYVYNPNGKRSIYSNYLITNSSANSDALELVGGFNSWIFGNDNYKFYQTNVPNVYRTRRMVYVSNDNFKVGKNGWGIGYGNNSFNGSSGSLYSDNSSDAYYNGGAKSTFVVIKIINFGNYKEMKIWFEDKYNKNEL